MEVREPSAKYLAHIGYKQTEVGVIPEDWSLLSLSSLSAFITKGSTPTTYGFKWEQAGVLFLRSECVSENGLDLSQSMFISEAAHASLRRSKVREGDILITITGYVGRAIIFRNADVANINQHIARVRVISPEASNEFVYYALSQPSYRGRFNSITTGQAYPQISLKQVRDTKVPLPPTKAEQEAIAEALGDADALIESLEQLLAKKRHLKQGAMQQLLTGKKRLPGFSGEWEVKTFNEVCWFQEGPGVRNTQFTTSGVKLLNGTNIFRGVLNLDTTSRFISEREAYGAYSHFLADAGDIVIASSGITIERFHEKVAFVRAYDLPFCMNTSTIRFKPFAEVLASDFLFQYLTSDSFKRAIGGQATGSAQLNFGPSHVAKVPVSLPPYSEQTAIAAILSDMDAELAALETKLAKARSLKQGMMQELLTGRIRLVNPGSNVANARC